MFLGSVFMAFNNKIAVIWGDSVAKGVIWNEERGRYTLSPHAAAAIVSENTGISVNNRSRMGLTSSEGIALMKSDIDKGVKGDYAVIEFGGNDCDFLWKEISDNPNGKHYPRTTAAEYENNIKEMIKKAREHKMKPVLLTLPPINSKLYFNFISKGKSPENILSWLGDTGHIYRYHERYSAIVTKIARECHCRLIDIRSAFLDIWDTKDFFCADGIHPSQKGQEFIGNTILKAVSD